MFVDAADAIFPHSAFTSFSSLSSQISFGRRDDPRIILFSRSVAVAARRCLQSQQLYFVASHQPLRLGFHDRLRLAHISDLRQGLCSYPKPVLPFITSDESIHPASLMVCMCLIYRAHQISYLVHAVESAQYHDFLGTRGLAHEIPLQTRAAHIHAFARSSMHSSPTSHKRQMFLRVEASLRHRSNKPLSFVDSKIISGTHFFPMWLFHYKYSRL